MSRMINRAIGVLRGKITNAMAHAPPPPKPASEMNVIEIVEYNKIPSMISYDRWWLFTWFVMVPVTIASGINAWIVENEHLSHGPPPYIPYDHLEQRAKDYPWRDGKRSLFHHEYYNPVPGQGYSWQKKEDDDE
ncbi:hypothetical protein ACHWQZ_G018694 [Mnemiopsis leidyi]